MNQYDHRKIEAKWQKFWQENKTFRAKDDSKKEKYYVLDMFPYPSGAGLHVGHPLGYTATDVVSRKRRHEGYELLHPIGWDAFGLPAENYAIKTKVHPEKSTTDNIKTFKRQVRELGFSYDWDREIGTCYPEYYKWTQWFFAFLYKNNLAYRKKAPVNWCNDCNTVLANEQVINGKCERCKNEVVQKKLEQWFFRITDFIEDDGKTSGLISGLEKIDWPNSTKISQRNWIGRSEGAEVDFEINGEKVTVFTTRPDTLFGATYFVLAPEHPLVEQITTEENKDAVQKYIQIATSKSELERSELSKEKTGVPTGAFAVNPVNQEKIPVWIADYVMMGYGTGAIMAVPAHDERDYGFAKKYKLEIREVVSHKTDEKCFSGEGTAVNSDFLDNLSTSKAKEKIIAWLEENGCGKQKINYKLRDWLVSRQRYWGAPIPIAYDDEGNEYLLPEDEIPVHLPNDVDFVPHGESPLQQSKKFHNAKCLKRIEEKLKKSGDMPKDRTLVKRESDTMDTFVCSSWYMFRFMDPQNEIAFASEKLLNHWGPIDLYVGGAEHTVLHLLYARFFTKALHKHGYINYDEPFAKLRHQGMILAEDGRKMSKSLGNVINPDDIVVKFGADTLRCYEMFMGPFDQRKVWSTGGVEGIKRFLDRVYRVSQKSIQGTFVGAENFQPLLHQTIKIVTDHIDELRFNTAISQMMILTNELTKLDKIPRQALQTFALLLSPFAPHMTEEIWHEVLKNEGTIAYEKWPEYDEKYLVEDVVTYAVQVNGKVRGDFEIAKDAKKDEVIAEAKKLPKVQAYLEQSQIVKEVFVPERIVGFVVK